MSRADIFLSLFNRLDEHLCAITGLGRDVPYQKRLNKAAETNTAVKQAKAYLQTYGYLRNAIVHDSSYPPTIVAEPRDAVIEQFRDTVERVLKPVPLSTVMHTDITCFRGDNVLADVLAYMGREGFS